jgi:16S rRNA (adenine1518-N6/adenine1519-N6)-dimethyltransferase
MRLLVDSAGIGRNDVVLEVGCGTGSLTEALAERAGKVVAVEIDPELARIATEQLAECYNVEVLQSDVLEAKNTISGTVKEALADSQREYTGRLLLVANLPYSVASPTMMNLITSAPAVERICVTVQKEVAERMAAGPSGKQYGSLSIFLAATGEVKLLRTLKPTVFWPQPEVESAVITYVRSEEKAGRIRDMTLFKEVVSLFMQHRRKMVKACTRFATGSLEKVHIWRQVFTDCCIDPHVRPEELPCESYIAIANMCSEFISKS